MDWTSIWSNEWFVGILCGIISGIIVYWVTNRFYSRKQDREYQQKVKAANNEILYTIRPLIVSRSLPTEKIWLSLIQATSRKYQVGIEDLYSVSSLRNDLIKEVLDNPFLDVKQKGEYAELLESFEISFHKEYVSDEVAQEIERAKKRYQTKAEMNSRIMSLLAGVAAGVSTRFQDFLLEYGTIIIASGVIFILLVLVCFIVMLRKSRIETAKE